MNQRILISGASIAGLTVAHWLARYGFRPTVVERAPGLRAGGNGVDVRDHAVAVAERMGIMPSIRAAATDVQGMKFVDAADRTVARLDTAGASEVEIMRGDLVALLHRATGAGVEYLFGDSIRGLAQDDDGVTVTFDHAGSRRFDLVIGADGMHSNVRRLAFGPESQFLRYKDHYFAFANADAALGENRWVTMYNQPGKMAGVYRSGNHAQAKAYFIFRSGPLRYDVRDVEQHKRLVSQVFGRDISWQIQELLAGALADPDFYFDALSQVHMPSWSTGRVGLVGDAAACASPASGAGAELALVGAYRLAGELASASGDHRVAFAQYQESHRDLVHKKQQIGPNVRLMVPKTHGGRWIRDGAAWLPILRAMTAAERLLRVKAPRALPEYVSAI
ncbi:2-polyprenyl-6-methoxyphenol hydroxylase-like FAD-dependent oxidoreductase [Micromonospora luteifusca]|uniref:2-polyprenyl-6-methoxyphenol hydroxylase-like FAD-dependent oxidoreductase n=1 Tax=Micromonospora luteifusca TaxID=709860 RepID=A0ABS2LVU1_9ACTN|nr:FAD-dependent monooxygenase [Micromonospora luteifusca]MBM7492288.1 2-polyprenyl-6-methoxyphenol hydroxylase-like FAD-dependent oxidoreductase [Micromonospora luteifusca]